MASQQRDRDGRRTPGDAAGRRRRPGPRPRDRFGRPLERGARDELGDRREPEEVVADVAEAVDGGRRLFDEERFFEAHEFFEHVWKRDGVAVDREFWKGVTQVAVGCCHVQRGNPAGARTLLTRAAGRLEAYPSPHRGVDTAALAAAARTLAERVRDGALGPDVGFPRFPVADAT